MRKCLTAFCAVFVVWLNPDDNKHNKKYVQTGQLFLFD